MTRLHRVSQTAPGYTRRRQGRGFVYLDQHGRRIGNGRLRRIRSLAIPPAWREVWICPDEDGHLQATGTDDAGRRQYLYHDEWRRRRDREKFHRIERFADALPELRRRVAQDLRGEDPTRERVLACAVRLLDRGLFRVGCEDYAQENGSYGLSTLQKEHVTIARDHAEFDFIGKAGKRQIRVIKDPELLPLLRTLRRRRNGDHAFLSWRDAEGWHPVRATDINGYVKAISGDEFSSKDFRTWHATVLAALMLAERGAQRSERARKRAAAGATQGVADHLGNTPAVARRSYVDPRIIDRFYEGDVIRVGGGSADMDGPMQRRVEAAVLELLRPRREGPLAIAA